MPDRESPEHVTTEISIERVLLGHSPAEVLYDCR
jgi:hypothetical protein